MDHVQLRLDLVAADVVDGGHVFVQDQMFRRGREPGRAKRTVPAATVSQTWTWTVQPVHPGPVLVRLQDALWDHVDHQRCGVLGASRLVPGPDEPLRTGLGSDPLSRYASPPQLLVGGHGVHKGLGRTLHHQEGGARVGGRAHLLRSDLEEHKVSRQEPQRQPIREEGRAAPVVPRRRRCGRPSARR